MTIESEYFNYIIPYPVWEGDTNARLRSLDDISSYIKKQF